MVFDSTFWVAVSFIIFIAVLIYFKIPQKVSDLLSKMISDIKTEISESEKLRNESKELLSKAQTKLDTAKKQSNEILNKAKVLISGERAIDYGDAYVNHKRIAELWTTILGKNITVEQVYACMIAVKLSRIIETPDHEDSWIDICGYAALGGEDDYEA